MNNNISEELLKLNKQEEFEYFKQIKQGSKLESFIKWNLNEHQNFINATSTLDVTKESDLEKIQAMVNNGNSRFRSIDEINMHISVYKDYCNKQKSMKSQSAFLSNITNNNYQHLLDSLDTNINSINKNNQNSINSDSVLKGSAALHSTSSLMSAMTPKNTIISSSKPTLTEPPVVSSSSSKATQQQQQQQPPPQPDKLPAKSKSKAKAKAKASAKEAPFPLPPQPPPQPPKLEVEYSNDQQSAANKKNNKILSEPWTAEDQKKLEEALVKYPSSRFSSVSRWQSISKDLGISPKAVALRYNQMLNNLLPNKQMNNNNNNNNPTDDYNQDLEDAMNGNPKKRKQPASKPSKASAKKKEKLEVQSSPSDYHPPPPPQISLPSSPNTSQLSLLSQPLPQSIQHQQQLTPSSKPLTENQKNFSLAKVEDLIQKNALLLEEIKKNIMLNQHSSPESVNILKEFIDNSNTALKSSMIWSMSSSEMPPIPLKVSNMVVGILTANDPSTTQYSSLKKPLPDNLQDWNLVIPNDK
ncbi:myb domain-containing protein [Tieghemostelium lacteum]|uniref:Myb domain-containing protein n=1 Tax=Tieghemostelium lacteum TaxID=361077 RepID=A0A151Z822_TIELA|nr:myb domain-containing protein [Tieghemostelium lacteum]|eukprot:KYQ89934.1 myb domain-containing protein [Tieghemostelium lacteum]